MISRPARRWWICGMLFCASAIAYIDRQAFSIVAPIVTKEFQLGAEQLGRILAAFLLAYTFGQALAGRFFDWAGSRLAFALSIGVWSLANALTATATGIQGFLGCRFALGLGESGNFPGGVKVVSEWFPPPERSFAGGIFTSGASVGGLLAGPMVSMLAERWGWRAAFVLTGSLGFFWLAGWLFLYRAAAPAAATESNAGQVAAALPAMGWLELLAFRQVWAVALARFLEESAFWVWLFWLPKYMVDAWRLSVSAMGWLMIIPFLALDIGYLSGGWITSRLSIVGGSIPGAKLRVMSIAALLMMTSLAAAFCSSLTLFLVLMGFCLAGHGAWFSNALTLPADIAPRGLVASLYGITALGGGLGGMIANETTGIVVARSHSYAAVFAVAGVLPIVATALLRVLGGRMEPVDSSLSRASAISE
jgi:ACS family hexuronate transporter-like MFS transporter